MEWKDVGNWIKSNGAASLGLVGNLLAGNVPGAIAAGASLVASATGSDDPQEALRRLQADPATLVELEKLANDERESLRKWQFEELQARLQDQQHAHHETQTTIREGDKATDQFVRRTRPQQSWLSLFAALAYVFGCLALRTDIDYMVLGMLLTLPWAYAGLRQTGKLMDAWATRRPQA